MLGIKVKRTLFQSGCAANSEVIGTTEAAQSVSTSKSKEMFTRANYVNTLADIVINLDPKYRNWGVKKIKNTANLKGFDDVSDVAQKVLDEGFDSFTVGDYIKLVA